MSNDLNLLAALKALVAAVPELCECERHEIESNALDDAEAAIAKAEGASRITCHFCGRDAGTVDEVVQDWVPSFYYVGDEFETLDPVCPSCQEQWLTIADDGELICDGEPPSPPAATKP